MEKMSFKTRQEDLNTALKACIKFHTDTRGLSREQLADAIHTSVHMINQVMHRDDLTLKGEVYEKLVSYSYKHGYPDLLERMLPDDRLVIQAPRFEINDCVRDEEREVYRNGAQVGPHFERLELDEADRRVDLTIVYLMQMKREIRAKRKARDREPVRSEYVSIAAEPKKEYRYK